MCDRCRDPNKTEVNEYTVHKTATDGSTVKEKRNLCDDCARTYIDADIKLTGGKREAEPEASTEVSEEPTIEPAARPSRRRG